MTDLPSIDSVEALSFDQALSGEVPVIGDPQDRLAQLLAHPDPLRSVHAPVVELHTGECAGYQAGVRTTQWSGYETGVLERIARETGLTGQYGAVGVRACLLSRATMPGERFLLLELPGGSLGYAPVQRLLADEDDLVGLVFALTPAAGAAAGANGVDEPEDVVAGLRARGALIALPILDAGYPELVAVERWRPNAVRLPGRLIRNLHADDVRRRVVRNLADLASEIGAEVVAEDVETLDEVWALRDLGVRYGRGWLFGRARPGFVAPPADVCRVLGSIDLAVGAVLTEESAHRVTAAAAATFSESTPPAIGIFTERSHRSVVSGRNPSPSVPKTRANLSGDSAAS